MADRIVVITGATACGKTDVALQVARSLDGEIVSMDSRQVYRWMDVGTAKPSSAARREIPHHGLDLIDPDQRYSAGRFATDARRWIAETRSRGRVPIIAGGSGFFLRALTRPLFAEPQLESGRRERLKSWLAGQSPATLERWTGILEPSAAGAGSDPQRLARRIEVALLTGRPLSWWHDHAPPAAEPLSPLVFLLDLPRHELYLRINARVHAMVANGLADEVSDLLQRGYDLPDPGMNAVGYIEMIPCVRGQRSLAEAMTLIQNATRGYARRQLTWFRSQLPRDTVTVDARDPANVVAKRITETWRRDRP